MLKLYKNREVLFAVLWIVAYCAITIPIRGNLGDSSVWMLVALAVLSAGITIFVKKNHLEEKYGLSGWTKNQKRLLYLIPMWVLVTGNLWGGFGLTYKGMNIVYAALSMLLIGFVEEMLFRGFLFKALLKKRGVKVAVIVSAVTFGIGHIVNLLAGQASIQTVLQVFFAIAWGFIFTMVFYKGKSLIPCIIAHGLVNALSLFAHDYGDAFAISDWAYVGTTIVVAIVYCIYLRRLKDDESEAYS